MDKPLGIVTDADQQKLIECVADIKEHEPFMSGTERMLIYDRWDDERFFTVAEAKEIFGIHTRIGAKKDA